jgi:ribosomal-protein-alanine N-acetyltransferase
MSLLVTPAAMVGAEVLAALHQTCFAAGWDKTAFVQLLAMPGAYGFVAAHDQRPDGLILCRAAADEAEVLTLAVRPGQRRRGLATLLLGHAMATAQSLGAAAMFLEVAADNQAARALYLANGFGDVGRRPRYYDNGADALTMKRDLAAAGPFMPYAGANDGSPQSPVQARGREKE